ncbi:MAG: class I SAM-dependent methyltransferase [Planctomycetota bacterium]|jgi:SAM-dependent methyltransferase
MVEAIDEDRLSEVILGDVSLRLLEPHVYSVLPSGEEAISYDHAFGTIYDLVACNRLYNRIVWGYSTSEYHSLCSQALESSKDGWILDIGCGSLAFSAKTYLQNTKRPVALLDRSLKLLLLAKSRLVKRNGEVPANMVFLHGDALRLPFEHGRSSTIISLNLLHMFDDEDAKKVLQGMKDALSAGGTMSLTTLVENERFADRYLRKLGRKGMLVPRNADRIHALFQALGLSAEIHVRGNLAFIRCGGSGGAV